MLLLLSLGQILKRTLKSFETHLAFMVIYQEHMYVKKRIFTEQRINAYYYIYEYNSRITLTKLLHRISLTDASRLNFAHLFETLSHR